MECENGDFESKLDSYEITEQIGRGKFGSTFLALHKTERKKYILKKIRLAKQTEKFKRMVHHEMKLLAKLNNPYIEEFKDSWMDKQGNFIFIVTSYNGEANMAEIIEQARGTYFPEEKVCQWLTQLLLALDYLHSNRVIHGDLKCSNIFLTKGLDILLGDSGHLKLLNTEDLASSVAGIPNYMCPELQINLPYGYKSGIWSLGCCIFEIAAHQPAFKAQDKAELISKINRSLFSPLPIEYSSTLKQLIRSMLRKNPEHRPTAADLLRHPHLQPHLRCCVPSSAFLPIKPPVNNLTESPRKSLSPKMIGVKSGNRDEHTSLTNQSNLETKDVDPISFSLEISASINNSDNRSALSETSVSNEHRQRVDFISTPQEDRVEVDASSGPLEDVTEIEFTSDGANSQPGEEHEENVLNSCCQQVREEAQNELDVSNNNENLTISVDLACKNNEEVKENSLSTKLAALSCDSPEKGKEKQNTLQRSDALESLLELSAKLLKQNKIGELAGILRPFGEEAESSRETAIWLTKSLMSAQKND